MNLSIYHEAGTSHMDIQLYVWPNPVCYYVTGVLKVCTAQPDDGLYIKIPETSVREANSKAFHYLIKVLLIGDSSVGKSCILMRFCSDEFTPSFIATIGIDFKIRNVDLDGKRAKFQVWDTAGQERFKTITTAYYRSAMGFLLVYDVCDEKSFEDIREWYSNIKEHARDNVEVILVGNKKDMTAERRVSPDQGRALAQELGLPFIEVSAKTAEGVDDAFLTLARNIRDNMGLEAQPINKNTIKISESKSSSGCC